MDSVTIALLAMIYLSGIFSLRAAIEKLGERLRGRKKVRAAELVERMALSFDRCNHGGTLKCSPHDVNCDCRKRAVSWIAELKELDIV